MTKELGEIHIYKREDRGRIKFFIHIKKGNRIVGKVINQPIV